MLYFSEHGYDIYLFEGPGQGGVLREQGKKFTYKWEKPVCSVLDYFNLEDVILIGVSLGGMLAPRVAAFEKRISHVVAWSIFPNFLEVSLYDLPKSVQSIFQMLDVADQITQDVLILHGKNDHFIDWRLYKEEVDSLKNAKSITLRLFTEKESASNHCQCGNTKLVLDTIMNWLKTV